MVFNSSLEPLSAHDGYIGGTVIKVRGCSQVKVRSGESIKLAVWDTAGAEQFESLSRMYYHGSQAALCCFDASQHHSFEKLQFWVPSAAPLLSRSSRRRARQSARGAGALLQSRSCVRLLRRSLHWMGLGGPGVRSHLSTAEAAAGD